MQAFMFVNQIKLNWNFFRWFSHKIMFELLTPRSTAWWIPVGMIILVRCNVCGFGFFLTFYDNLPYSNFLAMISIEVIGDEKKIKSVYLEPISPLRKAHRHKYTNIDRIVAKIPYKQPTHCKKWLSMWRLWKVFENRLYRKDDERIYAAACVATKSRP